MNLRPYQAWTLYGLGHVAMLLFLPHSVWNWMFVKSEEIQGDGPGPWLPPLPQEDTPSDV